MMNIEQAKMKMLCSVVAAAVFLIALLSVKTSAVKFSRAPTEKIKVSNCYLTDDQLSKA